MISCLACGGTGKVANLRGGGQVPCVECTDGQASAEQLWKAHNWTAWMEGKRMPTPQARYYVEIRQDMYRVIDNTTGGTVANSNSFLVASRMRDSKNDADDPEFQAVDTSKMFPQPLA